MSGLRNLGYVVDLSPDRNPCGFSGVASAPCFGVWNATTMLLLSMTLTCNNLQFLRIAGRVTFCVRDKRKERK
jgi:hypothetical protein